MFGGVFFSISVENLYLFLFSPKYCVVFSLWFCGEKERGGLELILCGSLTAEIVFGKY